MILSGRTINGRYRLHEKVREDPLGEYYHAGDMAEDGAPVIFTVYNREMASRRPEDIIRFKSEARKLVDLNHDNCAVHLDTGSIFDFFFLITRHYDGIPLFELLKHGKSFDFPAVLSAALGIARGLGFIHENRIILNNLNPNNIVISNTGLKIINAGASHIRDPEGETDPGLIMNVFEYLSPEESGLAGPPPDERSDLFSLGAVLYQMLYGVSPFRGTDVSSTVYRVIVRDPEPAPPLTPGVPGIFTEILRRLLEKDPDERYQTARGLIMDLEALERGDKDILPGTADRPSVPRFHTAMVGREAELEKMKALYDGTLTGEGSLCLVSGDAGAGKTRLLEELERHVFSRGGTVLYCKCNEGYGMSPYRAIGDLLGSFMKTYHAHPPDKRRALRDYLSREFRGLGAILVSLKSELGEIFENREAPFNLEERSESARFHGAAAGFFLRLGALGKGLVIALDDIQWSDEGSIAVIKEILSGLSRLSVQVVLAARSESPTSAERLWAFREISGALGIPCLEIEAGPLDAENTELLVKRILHARDLDVKDSGRYLHERTGGNVFFTISLLREMLEKNALLRTGSALRIDGTIADSLGQSDSLIETILSRVGHLEPEEISVLSYAAALGGKFQPGELITLSGLDGDTVVSITDRAMEYQVLRAVPGERNTCLFFHDRIKEVLYGSVPPGDRKIIHGKIARTEEGRSPGEADHYRIAHHYLLAGEDDAFLAHAIPAARSARTGFAYEDAEKILVTAIGLISSTADPRWAEAREELGRVYLITGNFAETIKACADVLPLTGDPGKKADILALKSEAHYRLNEWDECVSSAHKGLRLLGENFPRGPVSLVLRSAWEVARFIVNLPRAFRRKSGKPARAGDIKIIALYRALMENYMFRNAGLEFVYASLRMAVISQTRIGPSKELSISLIGMALIFAALARFGTAMKLLERALRLSLEAGDRWCEAYAYGFKGLVHEFMGNYREGIDRYYDLSMKTFTEIGDIKNIGVIHIGLVQSLYFLSDYETALVHNRESYAMARKIDDRFFTGMALVYYSKLYREMGDFEEAGRYGMSALDYNRSNSLSQNYCAALTEAGCLCIENREYGRAMEHLAEALIVFEKGYFSKQHTVHVYAHYAEAMLGDYMSRERTLSGGQRKKILRKIQRACRLAEKHGRRWKSHLGKACRVQGTLSALTGRTRRAEKYFRRAVEQCRLLGNNFELGRALFEYGLFLAQHRREGESRECMESAYDLFGRTGSRHHARVCGNILGIGKKDDKGSIRRVIRRERETSLKKISGALGDDESRRDIAVIINRIIEYLGAPDGFLFASAPGGLSLVYPDRDEDSLRVTALRSVAEKALESGKTGVVRTASPGASDDKMNTAEPPGPLCIILGSEPEPLGVFCTAGPRFFDTISEETLANIQDILSHALLLLAKDGKDPHEDEKTPNGAALTPSAAEKLEKAVEYIRANYRSEISRDGLALHLGMSPNYFGKVFRDYTGKKMNDFITELRIEDAVDLLINTDEKIIDIAYSAGFENLRTFNRAFLSKTGMTPQKYRENSQKQR